MARPYRALRTLREGGILDLSGIRLRMRSGDIQPGDLYVGERNTGPHLLVCKEVRAVAGRPDFVIPSTFDYSYDWGECVRVEEAP